MQNLTFNKKITIALISVILLISIGVSFFLTPRETAYADTSEYKIINFNQLLGSPSNSSFTLSNGLYTGSNLTISSTYSVVYVGTLIANHKYYFSFSNGSGFNYVQLTNNTNYSMTGQVNWVSGTYSNIYTCTNASYGFYLTLNASNTTTKFYATLIDLTQCFGSGSEPSVDECNYIFTSTYYSSTTSHYAVVYDNGYYQGYIDGLAAGDYNYSFNVNASNLAFTNLTYNGVSYSSATSINGSSPVNVYNTSFSGSDVYNYSCCVYLALPYTAMLGSSMQISYKTFAQMVNTSEGFIRDILFIAKDSSGNLFNIFTIDNYNYVYNDDYVYNFVLPVSVEGIYICTNLSNFFFEDFSLAYNIDSENVYLAAYNSAMETLQAEYSEGGNKYNEIYYAGKQDGVESANAYSFRGLITAVIDTPINAVLNMLDFDILGVNMKGFYLSLFTFAIILLVIKLVL